MSLKKTDIKLLAAALKSNGGGVPEHLHPSAAVVRMMDAGFIQRKPNSRTLLGSLLTITRPGKLALLEAQKGSKS